MKKSRLLISAFVLTTLLCFTGCGCGTTDDSMDSTGDSMGSTTESTDTNKNDVADDVVANRVFIS